MAEEQVTVRANRAEGAAQKYVLRADGRAGAWFTRQYAYTSDEFVPYWFVEGLHWHVWEGEAEGEGPPLKSCASLAEVKEFVRLLVAGPSAAG